MPPAPRPVAGAWGPSACEPGDRRAASKGAWGWVDVWLALHDRGEAPANRKPPTTFCKKPWKWAKYSAPPHLHRRWVDGTRTHLRFRNCLAPIRRQPADQTAIGFMPKNAAARLLTGSQGFVAFGGLDRCSRLLARAGWRGLVPLRSLRSPHYPGGDTVPESLSQSWSCSSSQPNLPASSGPVGLLHTR
jgi:hypothetical protein